MNNLASTLGYRPLSYERYLAPLQAYNQALQSQEDLLSDLTTKADIWNGLANQQTDKKAYAQYKKYADDLTAQANTLADKGLYEGSRRALLDLKNRYSKEIVPIENAYNTRKQQAELQQKARAAHPDMMYGRDAATTSLDTYLANPQYDALAQQYSGEQLKKNVEDAASALAREAHANPNIKQSLQQLLPYQYYAELERTGFKSEDVYKAIHSDKGSPILKQIVNDAIQASGIQGWDNYNAIKDQAYGYANQGLWKAVGTTKFGPLEDKYGMEVALENLKFAHQKKLQDEALAAQQPTYDPGLPVDADDVSFGADSDNAQDVYAKLKAMTGINGGNQGGTKVSIGSFKVMGTTKLGGNIRGAKNKQGKNEFKLFTGKNGRRMTKKEFIAQGATKADQEILANHYDNAIKLIKQTGGGGSNYASGIYQHAYKWMTGQGATHINMPTMNFSDNKKVFTDRLAPAIDNMGGVYEVTGGLNGWQKGKRVKSKDLVSAIDKEGDNESLRMYTSFDKNNPGYIVSIGEKKYFMPAGNMSAAAKQGFRYHAQNMPILEEQARQLQGQKNIYIAELKRRGFSDTQAKQQANAAYKQYEDKIGASMNAVKAEALRNIGWSIDGTYSDPTAKLFKQD